eukprot:g2303.t1
MNEAGVWLGFSMLLVIAWLTDICVRMLVDIGVSVGKTDYEQLCEHAWGMPGFVLVSFSMFGFAYGAMLAYLVIIGDTVPVIGKLANTSAASIGAVVVIVVIVIFRAPANAEQEEVHERIAPKSWNRVTHAAMGSATVLCAVLALVGYTTFRLCTRGNILNNLEAEDQYANVARLLLAFTMFFTYPMEFFVARQALHGLIFYRDRHKPYHTTSCCRHYTLSFLLWLSTLLIALVLPQEALGLILEYSGGLCASMMGYVLPAALAFHFRSPSVRGGWLSVVRRLPMPTLVLVIGLVSLTTSLYYATQPKDASDPTYCPETGAEN